MRGVLLLLGLWIAGLIALGFIMHLTLAAGLVWGGGVIFGMAVGWVSRSPPSL